MMNSNLDISSLTGQVRSAMQSVLDASPVERASTISVDSDVPEVLLARQRLAEANITAAQVNLEIAMHQASRAGSHRSRSMGEEAILARREQL
jgi:hypothetical protein